MPKNGLKTAKIKKIRALLFYFFLFLQYFTYFLPCPKKKSKKSWKSYRLQGDNQDRTSPHRTHINVRTILTNNNNGYFGFELGDFGFGHKFYVWVNLLGWGESFGFG